MYYNQETPVCSIFKHLGLLSQEERQLKLIDFIDSLSTGTYHATLR